MTCTVNVSSATPPGASRMKRGEGGAYIQKLKSGLIVRVNRKMLASSKDLSEDECKGMEMTPAQNEVFLAIDEFWKRYGYAPSLGDIAYLRGKTGKGNIKRIVDRLVALGVVKYMPNKKRSVRPVYINFRNIQ